VAIGGYFELELRDGKEYHPDAIHLNTGSNAFEAVLRERKVAKVFLPYYSCDALLRPLNQLAIKYEFYSIDENLEPIFDYSSINENEAFLAINYFGLKDKLLKKLGDMVPNLIVDNAQSFFSPPIHGIDTFYSVRKFFGVPDGAYLYTITPLDNDLETDISFARVDHLLRRIENGPDDGYSYFKENEAKLRHTQVRKMSNLTNRLLMNIDYEEVARRRRDNFQILHDALASYNQFTPHWDGVQVPMVYPFLSRWSGMREKLIEQKIYIAQYWKNVFEFADASSLEYHLAKDLLPLPIDQRYKSNDMKTIIDQITRIIQSN